MTGGGRVGEGGGDSKACTMVVGGLKDKSLQEGIDWFMSKLSEVKAAVTIDIFVKDGDETTIFRQLSR